MYDYKKYLNEKGEKKVSPSKLLNKLFPIEREIPEHILEKAGARGSAIHELIENYILGEKEPDLSFYEFMLENDDYLKVLEIWNNFKEEIKECDLIAKECYLEHFVSELDNLCGYIDYFDDKKIIDWKTNSALTKKDIEKYTLQMNLYRLMIFKTKNILIDDLYLFHLCKKYQKNKETKIKFNIIKCELIPFEWLEEQVEILFKEINKKEKNVK